MGFGIGGYIWFRRITFAACVLCFKIANSVAQETRPVDMALQKNPGMKDFHFEPCSGVAIGERCPGPLQTRYKAGVKAVSRLPE